MPAYTQLKSDIAGIQAVADAVKTSEEVAASRIQLLRHVSENLRTYVDDLRQILEGFSRHHDLQGNRFFGRGQGNRLLIVIGFDRGLTGGLDNRMATAVSERQGHFDRLLVLGQRMVRLLVEEGIEPTESRPGLSDQVTDQEVSEISQQAIESFLSGQSRSVEVLIPRFRTLATQYPDSFPFLPLSPTSVSEMVGRESDDIESNVTEAGATPGEDSPTPLGLPLFLPSPSAVAEGLVRVYLRTFFKARLMEAKLSELAARTVSSEHAAIQADKLVQQMNLNYFKVRRRELSRRQIESFFAHRQAVG